MEESQLLKLSLILSFGGLIAMWFLSANMGISTTSIDSITPDDVGRSLKACGLIKGKIVSKDHHTFFTLDDGEGEIKVVVFNTTHTQTPDEHACVVGQVDIYRGEIELVAKEVGDV